MTEGGGKGSLAHRDSWNGEFSGERFSEITFCPGPTRVTSPGASVPRAPNPLISLPNAPTLHRLPCETQAGERLRMTCEVRLVQHRRPVFPPSVKREFRLVR